MDILKCQRYFYIYEKRQIWKLLKSETYLRNISSYLKSLLKCVYKGIGINIWLLFAGLRARIVKMKI